jgi:hypothetical protein
VAPTLISPSPYIVHDTGANTTALTTASFTPSVGEVIVAKASTWDWSTNFGTGPTGGGLTWTKRVESLGTGSGGAYSVIWTAVVGGSPTSMTVSMTPTASSRHSMVVERWSGAQLAATPAVNTTKFVNTNPATTTLTSTGTGSVVTWVSSDTAAIDPATRVYASSATEEDCYDLHGAADGVWYYAYQAAASPGSQTFGTTAPSGQSVSICGIEIQDSNAAPPTRGTVTYVAASTPTPVGNTTSANADAVTPTLPTGTASGDRVYVIQAGNNTAGTTPTSWTALAKDVQVGPTGTAPGAGTGRRYLSFYYRDYDGAWTMPAFSLTSATQNTNALSAITLRKATTDTWDTPTASTAGNTSAATTAYSVTTGSLTTDVGMLLVGTALNDNVTASGESLSQTGATLTGLAERSDTGSATGNDVAIQSYTATVTTGATATLTLAATLSGASEGGSVVVAQTSTAAATSAVLWPRRRGPNYRR